MKAIEKETGREYEVFRTKNTSNQIRYMVGIKNGYYTTYSEWFKPTDFKKRFTILNDSK